MTAPRTGALEAMFVLINHGAKVDIKESARKQTALIWAQGEKHTELARALVKHGADIHAETTLRSRPLIFAAREGDAEVTEMLLDAEADVNEMDNNKLSALHVTTLRGHAKVAI